MLAYYYIILIFNKMFLKMVCHVTAEATANNLNKSNSDMEIIAGMTIGSLTVELANMTMMVVLRP